MSDDSTLLDRERLDGLLRELAEQLDRQGVAARLFVVGGAAIVLARLRDRLTRDVDAAFEPTGPVRDAAGVVAARHDLPTDWLNDAVKGFLPGSDPDRAIALDVPGLTVEVASPRYLFALKAIAARDAVDAADLRVLYGAGDYADVDDALRDVQARVPPQLLGPKVEFFVREALEGR